MTRPTTSPFCLRPATSGDLPRIHEVRHGTAENRLTDPSRVTSEEVTWYLDHAIFLVAEDDADIQGFACANLQTGYVWALFVIDGAHRRGCGTALLDAALAQLRQAGNRQAFLTTDPGTRAARFYAARGWMAVGENLDGEVVFRIPL
jgi:GNAT superfamily N-acetyltransferase